MISNVNSLINPLNKLAQRVGASAREVNKTTETNSSSPLDSLTSQMSAVLAALRLPKPQVDITV